MKVVQLIESHLKKNENIETREYISISFQLVNLIRSCAPYFHVNFVEILAVPATLPNQNQQGQLWPQNPPDQSTGE